MQEHYDNMPQYLQCSQCQKWFMDYNGSGTSLTPLCETCMYSGQSSDGITFAHAVHEISDGVYGDVKNGDSHIFNFLTRGNANYFIYRLREDGFYEWALVSMLIDWECALFSASKSIITFVQAITFFTDYSSYPVTCVDGCDGSVGVLHDDDITTSQ